jgi:hypothetical protein
MRVQVKEEGLKLVGTHQVVCAEDVDIVVGSVHKRFSSC